jgi:hypothetical protein
MQLSNETKLVMEVMYQRLANAQPVFDDERDDILYKHQADGYGHAVEELARIMDDVRGIE